MSGEFFYICKNENKNYYTAAVSISFFIAQISKKVKELAKPLETISYAESSHIGIGGEKSEIYNYFKNWKDNKIRMPAY